MSFLKSTLAKKTKMKNFYRNILQLKVILISLFWKKTESLLHSQNTGELEKDKDYDKDKFVAFLEKWKWKK
jgi:hypothetical protein